MMGEDTWRDVGETTSIHQAEVSRVRMWLDAQQNPGGMGPVTEWESERRFRQRSADQFGARGRQIHVPDGVATFGDGTRAAIEVELSRKQYVRLVEIVERLRVAYKLAVYAIPAGKRGDMIEGQVTKARQQVTEGHGPRGERNVLATGQIVVVRYPDHLAV